MSSVAPQRRERAFVMLWAIASVAHYDSPQPIGPWHFVSWASAALALCAPGSLVACLVLMGTGLVVMTRDLPAAANHVVVGLLVSVSVILAVLNWLWVRGRQFKRLGQSDTWLLQLQGPIALTLGVVYFFGAFHKLNAGFFDPATSCVGVILAQGFRLHGLAASLPSTLIPPLAWGVVLLEGVLAVLFFVPRLRIWGVLIGAAFHTLLAWAHFVDFSTYMLALYIAMLPASVFAGIGGKRSLELVVLGLVGYVAATVAIWTGTELVRGGLRANTVQVVGWMMAMAALSAGPMCRAARRWSDSPPAGTRLRYVLLMLPALATINGATIYLGFKSVANYSMFSNLRIEGGFTNHFLPARSVLLSPDIDELVEVVRFDVRVSTAATVPPSAEQLSRLRRQFRWLTEPFPVRIPRLELRRAVWLYAQGGVGVQVQYIENGIRRASTGITGDPKLAEPLSWTHRWLRAYRAVDPSPAASRCRW